MTDLIEIDGAMGEGGGQVLRTSLGLSLVTGRGFRIKNIRGSRKKPGLLRQHLACVKAAGRIGAAAVDGDEISSSSIIFRPQTILPGFYEFSISSAGSTTLVLQSILPGLLAADGPSTVVIRGGTHNPLAPTFDFLERVFFDVLRGMGVSIEATLHDYGFFPVGGGCIEVKITPTKRLQPFTILERGEILGRRATIMIAGLSRTIAEREFKVLTEKFSWKLNDVRIKQIGRTPSPGNLVVLEVTDGTCREMVTEIAVRGKRAEKVATDTCDAMRDYLKHDAPVGIHLADQLLIPMAMAEGGSFRCTSPTLHTRTNALVIEKFLGVKFDFVKEEKRCELVRLR